jgi:hypothetical protein
MKDFTIDLYSSLLSALKATDYSFLTVKDFMRQESKTNKITLRHDVDKAPENSLAFAKMQFGAGMRGTYYFRAKPPSFNKKIIFEIASLNHEIGYHYETMDICKGNVDKAYDEFCHYLDMFRKISPVETICMHGSPMSKYDNKKIWEKYDYRKLGIIAEPYFDLKFNEVFYITDTGRMWDSSKVSIRDRPSQKVSTQWPSYHSTYNIIEALYENTFPNKVMMTFHPQRWTNNQTLWLKELLMQNLKNQVKRFLVKK